MLKYLMVGDAVGAHIEFMAPRMVRHFHPDGWCSLEDGGPHGLERGQLTDDSEMAIALAQSLVSCGGYNPADVLDYYRQWAASAPVDMGNATRRGIAGSPDTREENQGNGALMRVAPIAMCDGIPMATLAEWAAADARLTHPSAVCVAVNQLFVIICAALRRRRLSRQSLYQDARQVADALDAPDVVRAALEGSQCPTSGTGWVMNALRMALYCTSQGMSVCETLRFACDFGEDTDTNCAIALAMVGAAGMRLPKRLLDGVLNCTPVSRPRRYWAKTGMAIGAKLSKIKML